MKVFISWSGKLSHQIAKELKEWFPLVINQLEPEAGADRITHKNIQRSLVSLDIIRKKIKNHKNTFSSKEWNAYEIKDLRMRATIFYVASDYVTRLRAFPLFLKSFLMSGEIKDLIKTLKPLLKF